MKAWVGVALLFCALPTTVFAECDTNGTSVVYINGILTSNVSAEDETFKLKRTYANETGDSPVTFITAYNPTHLAGGGDIIESITQAFAKPISSYDLNTMLKQLYPELSTRKVLLVGHSQGAFYVNELYGYLTSHGVPKNSIAAYAIATPASYVAGGGGYITSSNDKVINAIRDDEVNGNVGAYTASLYASSPIVSSALRANITIPPEQGWSASDDAGHALGVYLDGAGQKLAQDMSRELSRLTSAPATITEGCFVPPTPDLAYEAQSLVFGAADPIADGLSAIGENAASGVAAVHDEVLVALGSAVSMFQNTPGLSDAEQGAAAAMPIGAMQLHPNKSSAPKPEMQTEPTGNVAPITPPSDISTPPARAAVPYPSAPPEPETPTTQLIEISPGYGGGGAASNSSPAGGGSSTNTTIPMTTPAAASSSSAKEEVSIALSIASPSDGALFATSSVSLSGRTNGVATVFAEFGDTDATTSADASGNWSLVLVLPEGTSTVSLSAFDATGNTSATSSLSLDVDTTPPAQPAITVASCDASLLVGGCLLPVTSTLVAWSPAEGASQYALVEDGMIGATTTGISSVARLTWGATTTLQVVAYDEVGNAATSSMLDVAAYAQPLVINEIGWGGTGSSAVGNGVIHADQQWIELQNNSPYGLDISHLTLERSGGAPIPLSGVIAAKDASNANFFVVEPASVLDVPTAGVGTLQTPFALSTDGEQLTLVWSDGSSTTTLDATPDVAACGGWCAGSTLAQLGSNVSGKNGLYAPLSMERKQGAVDGTLASSWQNTDSYMGWLPGTIGAEWGTPGAPNSYGLPDSGVYCGSASHIALADALFDPGSDCEFLAKFITGDSFGSIRRGALYEGEIGSSTPVTASFGPTKALAGDVPVQLSVDTPTAQDFFFAIWEDRNFQTTHDTQDFNGYFTSGNPSQPPHGNYVTIPFMYQPGK